MTKQGVYWPVVTEKVLHFSLGLLERISPGLVGRLACTVFYTPLRRTNSVFRELKMREEVRPVRDKRIITYLAGKGPPVVFIHGWEMGAAHYEPLMSAMIDAGFSVVSCDLPAHGKSGGLSSDIVEIGDVILDLSRRYGPFVGAVGHSYGAAALARVVGAIENDLKLMVLFACPVTYGSMVGLFSSILGLGKKGRQRFVERIHARYFAMRFDRDLDFRRILNATKTPLLIVHDADDRVVPIQDSMALSAALSNATPLTTKGLGHQRLLRDAGVIERVVATFQQKFQNDDLSQIVQ